MSVEDLPDHAPDIEDFEQTDEGAPAEVDMRTTEAIEDYADDIDFDLGQFSDLLGYEVDDEEGR